jgi:hypothetical protein
MDLWCAAATCPVPLSLGRHSPCVHNSTCPFNCAQIDDFEDWLSAGGHSKHLAVSVFVKLIFRLGKPKVSYTLQPLEFVKMVET